MPIRIDELSPTALPSREHVVPAMKDGLTVKLEVGQIADVAKEGVAETYDPEGRETDAFDSANHAYNNNTSGLVAESAQGAIDELAARTGIHALTAKANPIDGDEIRIADSDNSWASRKLSWANMKSAILAAVKTFFGASGDAPLFACRAWVSFVGTGTVTIDGSGNVSSITDQGTGNYTVNFASAMPDANYSVIVTLDPENDSIANFSAAATPRTVYAPKGLKTTTNCRVLTGANASSGGGPIDMRNVNVAIFR